MFNQKMKNKKLKQMLDLNLKSLSKIYDKLDHIEANRKRNKEIIERFKILHEDMFWLAERSNMKNANEILAYKRGDDILLGLESRMNAIETEQRMVNWAIDSLSNFSDNISKFQEKLCHTSTQFSSLCKKESFQKDFKIISKNLFLTLFYDDVNHAFDSLNREIEKYIKGDTAAHECFVLLTVFIKILKNKRLQYDKKLKYTKKLFKKLSIAVEAATFIISSERKLEEEIEKRRKGEKCDSKTRIDENYIDFYNKFYDKHKERIRKFWKKKSAFRSYVTKILGGVRRKINKEFIPRIDNIRFASNTNVAKKQEEKMNKCDRTADC